MATTAAGKYTVSLKRVDPNDDISEAVIATSLHDIIRREAEYHGAVFDESNYDNVVAAIRTGKAQAHMITMRENGKSLGFVGGAVVLPTIHNVWNGIGFDSYPAIYFEDTCVDLEKSQEFRKQTGVGLGTFLMREMFRLSAIPDLSVNPFGFVSNYYVAEHTANSPIKGIYTKLGTTTETSPSGTILQFDRIPQFDRARKEMMLRLTYPWSAESQGNMLGHVFTVGWPKDMGNYGIIASFTQSISTFTGKPVARVQFTSNKNLPDDKEELESVLQALLWVGLDEIRQRKWMNGCVGSDDLSLFRTLRIHALNEPEIVGSLRGMGAGTRYLGEKNGVKNAMYPAVSDYSKLPQGILYTGYAPTPYEQNVSFKPFPERPGTNLIEGVCQILPGDSAKVACL